MKRIGYDKLVKIGSSEVEHKHTIVIVDHYTHVPRSKYVPHQSHHEMERRKRSLAQGQQEMQRRKEV